MTRSPILGGSYGTRVEVQSGLTQQVGHCYERRYFSEPGKLAYSCYAVPRGARVTLQSTIFEALACSSASRSVHKSRRILYTERLSPQGGRDVLRVQEMRGPSHLDGLNRFHKSPPLWPEEHQKTTATRHSALAERSSSMCMQALNAVPRRCRKPQHNYSKRA